MGQVRSASDSAKKFVARAKGAQDDYKNGVAGAGGRWKAGAASAGDAYRDGITGALANDSFIKGVNASGTEQKYQINATKLGPQRFADGVANAEQAYTTGVSPYVAAMNGFPRSPRGSRRSGNNIKRVQEQIDLMRATKAGLLG